MNYLILELWPYILGAFSIIIGLITAYSKGKSKQQEAQHRQQLEALKKKEELRNEIEDASYDTIISEFDRLYNDRRRR